jgi:putative ABC transport system substrate-binding protein
MRRREVIALLGGAAAWPLAARAQQGPLPVVAHMHAGDAEANRLSVKLFEDALRQSGFVAGENVRIEYHWASGRYDRLPKIAAELVSRRVAVIVAGTPVAAP